MNNCIVKAKFTYFQILFNSSNSSTTVMNNLTSKLKCNNSTTPMWQTQTGKFTTNNMTMVDFFLPEFSVTKIVTYKFHVDDSTEMRYNMILGRYLLGELHILQVDLVLFLDKKNI